MTWNLLGLKWKESTKSISTSSPTLLSTSETIFDFYTEYLPVSLKQIQSQRGKVKGINRQDEIERENQLSHFRAIRK